MLISLIAAMDRNHLIGADGSLPWHLPADLKRFKAITMGKPIVMGRKTYESIGQPLPGRHNIVVTRNRNYRAPGCTVVHSPDAALAAAGNAEEILIAGGGQLYRHFLPQAHRLYLTLIEATFSGDTYFPYFSEEEWERILEEEHEADEENPYDFRFIILARRESNERSAP